MRNYHHTSPYSFRCTLEEIDNLEELTDDSMVDNYHWFINLDRIKLNIDCYINNYKLKKIPIEWKRAFKDDCILLCFELDGQWWAKRHHNSQHFELDYDMLRTPVHVVKDRVTENGITTEVINYYKVPESRGIYSAAEFKKIGDISFSFCDSLSKKEIKYLKNKWRHRKNRRKYK